MVANKMYSDCFVGIQGRLGNFSSSVLFDQFILKSDI